NSIGLQNPGIDVVAKEYAPRWREWKTPVIVNLAGGSVDEYVHSARVLEDVAEVAGLELNISCPNISGGLDFGRDPVAAGNLVAAVRAVSERCIIVKLSPNVTDIAAVARAVESAGADAVSAVNTYIGRKIHRATGRSVLPLGTGGLSGPAIQPLALAAVAAVCDAVRIPVIAVGGILDAASARDFLVVGASAIQVGTATFVNPETALQVLDGLRD